MTYYKLQYLTILSSSFGYTHCWEDLPDEKHRDIMNADKSAKSRCGVDFHLRIVKVTEEVVELDKGLEVRVCE